jgi:hypothetical protein
MARKTVLISDVTGKMIDEKNAAQVIKYSDARRRQVVLDVNADEVMSWLQKASSRPGEGVGRRLQAAD